MYSPEWSVLSIYFKNKQSLREKHDWNKNLLMAQSCATRNKMIMNNVDNKKKSVDSQMKPTKLLTHSI